MQSLVLIDFLRTLLIYGRDLFVAAAIRQRRGGPAAQPLVGARFVGFDHGRGRCRERLFGTVHDRITGRVVPGRDPITVGFAFDQTRQVIAHEPGFIATTEIDFWRRDSFHEPFFGFVLLLRKIFETVVRVVSFTTLLYAGDLHDQARTVRDDQRQRLPRQSIFEEDRIRPPTGPVTFTPLPIVESALNACATSSAEAS